MTGRGTAAGSNPRTNWLLVYGSLIVLAEAALALVNPMAGVIMLTAIFVTIISHHGFAPLPRDPGLPILALLPLVRLLSMAMPIPGIPTASVYLLVGGPALIGAALAARAIGLSRRELGFALPKPLYGPLLVAALGVPLGLVARTIGGVAPIAAPGLSPILFLIVVAVFIVLFEEFAFRGLLYRVAATRSASVGLAASSILYAAMYFGSGSASAVLFMGLTGVVFGLAVSRTGTLWGVLGAHLIMRLLIQA